MVSSLKPICDNYRYEGGAVLFNCLREVIEYVERNGLLLEKFDDEVNTSSLDPLIKDAIKDCMNLLKDGYHSNYFDLYFDIKITKAIRSNISVEILNELLLVKFTFILFTSGRTNLFNSIYRYFVYVSE